MGKGGRIACIALPLLLTIASLVCLVFTEIAGWNKGTLGEFYFFKANFTQLDISGANVADNTTTLTKALQQANQEHLLADIYEVHLWNYCQSNGSTGQIDHCTGKKAEFVFDPVAVWGLNNSAVVVTATGSSSNPIESGINDAKNKTETEENDLLGKAGKDALDAYRHVAKWMFIAYEVAFWSTLATIVVSILAIFSRWGSFLTWILSFVSSAFNFGAVLTSTILFAALVGSLNTILNPYNIHLDLGTHALAVTWLSVVFSWAATLFWLFSICCCSGRSNPHHRNNKGGLWNAEPKGMGYNDHGHGRGVRVEKTGGGYERVGSPFLGHAENEHGDRVPLNDYPQPAGYSQGAAYEPFRHS